MTPRDSERRLLFHRLSLGWARGPRCAKRLGDAFAILLLGAGLGFAPSSTHAQAAATATGDPEVQRSGAQEATDASVLTETSRERLRERHRRRVVWWDYTREALFADIDLSPEQAREVDALIEGQLRSRAEFEELTAELNNTRLQGDEERGRALRAKHRARKAQLSERHEIMEEMRALLTQEQRPSFDMNRARLVAEGQQPGTPGERRRAAPSPR